ncbi:uncharacterized protein LOC123934692 [Meles meles]|uniref:uncharacterized protein LOC123934692 n=1 Tax=Meles meles TaxID=9662 RepID=UPI001E69BA0A|nr:uncharacterized protein LOC123934692 [Meles meles]
MVQFMARASTTQTHNDLFTRPILPTPDKYLQATTSASPGSIAQALSQALLNFSTREVINPWASRRRELGPVQKRLFVFKILFIGGQAAAAEWSGGGAAWSGLVGQVRSVARDGGARRLRRAAWAAGRVLMSPHISAELAKEALGKGRPTTTSLISDVHLAHTMIGKAVEHMFETEDGSKDEWRGLVLARAPIMNTWFYITYKKDPVLPIYQLLDDYKEGDLRIMPDSNDSSPAERKPGEVADSLVGKQVEYAKEDGSKRTGMVIHQVEAKPSVYFIKFDDNFHIYVYDLVKIS